MQGSINSIESFGLVDGPGVRCVVFMNGCKLRCKYCHNPEMWCMQANNYTVSDLVTIILRYKPYFYNNGGVTFSGGEPLLQAPFLVEVMKELKKENVHICLDTSGVGNGNYKKILELTDLVLFDVKYANKEKYKELTGFEIEESENFITELNNQNKPVWIRQVVVPGMMDTEEYLKSLKEYLKKINNVQRIDFLPYHNMGKEKYAKLGIKYPFDNIPSMDKEKCHELYLKFTKLS